MRLSGDLPVFARGPPFFAIKSRRLEPAWQSSRSPFERWFRESVKAHRGAELNGLTRRETQMSGAGVSVKHFNFGRTTRRDAWWAQPALVFVGLSAFLAYATWAGLQGDHYFFGNYLSPFYSPVLFGDSPHRWLAGSRPGWWPTWLLWSPAFLIIWAPAGFRVTCYYYRGAYYKAFWADPPSCTVGEPRSHYRGERSFPLILQNVHRYFLYLALAFIVILGSDAWHAMWFADPLTGKEVFGVGVGTIVLTINVVLLAGYTFGCHSLRHLIGGRLDRLSGARVQQTAYNCVSCFNRVHMGWAWPSLFFVAFSDLYVRLCSMGLLSDWRLF